MYNPDARKQKVLKDLKEAFFRALLNLGLYGISIRNAKISPDFRILILEVASLEHSVSDSKIIEILKEKRFLIVREIRKYINLKYFPTVRFQKDSHQERIKTMESLFERENF
jgi:ribosome-binding factor A